GFHHDPVSSTHHARDATAAVHATHHRVLRPSRLGSGSILAPLPPSAQPRRSPFLSPSSLGQPQARPGNLQPAGGSHQLLVPVTPMTKKRERPANSVSARGRQVGAPRRSVG